MHSDLEADVRFNPRPRVGGDVLAAVGHWGQLKFQSTPPRGGRLSMTWPLIKWTGFQSTPPRGGRRYIVVL